MRYLFKFNLQEFNSPVMINNYLNYRIDNCGILQNEIIEKIGIAPATYFRAKKSGFADNPKVFDSLCRFFELKQPDKDVFKRVEDTMARLYTFIYLVDHQEQNKIFFEIYDLYNEYKNSVIEIPLLMLLSMAANKKLFKEQDLSCMNNFEKLMELFIPDMSQTIKYMALYSLFEHALHINDNNKAIQYGARIKPYIDGAPVQLQLMMIYVSMNTAFFMQDYNLGTQYATRLLVMQSTYFSPVIRNNVAAILITFYAMQRDYKKIIELATGELVYLQFDKEHQLQYFTTLSNLATAYTTLERYEEALENINDLLVYPLEGNMKPEFLPSLIDKKRNILLIKMFVLYKLNDFDGCQELYYEIKKTANPKREFYLNIMKGISDGGKWNIKRCDKMLREEELKNGIMGVADIHYFLRNECIYRLSK